MIFPGAELLPDLGQNTINPPALTLFIAVVSGIVAVLIEVVKTRRRADEARESVKKVVENTAPLSNGFAGDVIRHLESIERRTVRVEDALQKHMEWHIENRREG